MEVDAGQFPQPDDTQLLDSYLNEGAEFRNVPVPTERRDKLARNIYNIENVIEGISSLIPLII
jgi:hypothetical protein